MGGLQTKEPIPDIENVKSSGTISNVIVIDIKDQRSNDVTINEQTIEFK